MTLYLRLGATATTVCAAALMGFVVAGCPANGGANGDEPNDENQPFFPADFRSSYTLVRDCRNSIEHGSTVRVWVNDVGAAAYLADQNPLPVGTIVVKEEFAGTNCDNDADLTLFSAMKKEAAGFDPADADWRWQEVRSPDRAVISNTKDECVRCHRDPECIIRDYMCTEP